MKYEQKIISLSYNLNPIFSKRAHVRGHTHTHTYIYIYIYELELRMNEVILILNLFIILYKE